MDIKNSSGDNNFNNLVGGLDYGLKDQVEIVTQFFNYYAEVDLGTYQTMALDLYRAITCYRLYESIEVFLEVNPELEPCKEDIEELWKEFANLSHSELAEIAIKLLNDI